jgi:hypothetical protein
MPVLLCLLFRETPFELLQLAARASGLASGLALAVRPAGLAGPQPLPPARMVVQRKVSSRGGIQVARQRIQAGFSNAGQTVTIQLGDTTLRVIDEHGELLTTVPRASNAEISRFKAYGTRTGHAAR